MTEKSFLTIDQQRYYIQSTTAQLSARPIETLDQHLPDHIPATAIEWHKPYIEDDELKRVCRQYKEGDDVWNTSFSSFIILLLPFRPESETTATNIVCLNNTETCLPNGPIVIEKVTGRTFKVFKLVKDTHHAFLSAIIPETEDVLSFREFPEQEELEIALPSRLYHSKTTAKPFAGLRIAVKDIIDLKGLSTGYGSKAWRELYPPKQLTASCVQIILDAGAVLVGKVKSAELAEGVDPSDWTEGVCPYNPRGDGQQKPSSSSTGSASAAAAYEWLDLAYGTDTGGSIRHPAGVQGIFGQRPTQDIIEPTGVLGATDLWNTVGILARSIDTFTKVGSYLVDTKSLDNQVLQTHKYRILCPTRLSPTDKSNPPSASQKRWFPHPESDSSTWTEAEQQLEAVVAHMEAELHCKRTTFNLDERWQATRPTGQSASLDEATGFIYGVITTSSACKNGVDQFIADYSVSHDGQQPPMSAIVRRRMDYGRGCCDTQVAAALEATAAFSKWVLNELFGPSDEDTTTLLVFPQSQGTPDYREDATDNTELFKEFFSIYSFAYLCGCPDYTIPIGEVSYMSRITQKTEHLPVSFSLVGRPGSDLQLFDILDRLHRRGAITDVAAGKRLYPDR